MLHGRSRNVIDYGSLCIVILEKKFQTPDEVENKAKCESDSSICKIIISSRSWGIFLRWGPERTLSHSSVMGLINSYNTWLVLVIKKVWCYHLAMASYCSSYPCFLSKQKRNRGSFRGLFGSWNTHVHMDIFHTRANINLKKLFL